MEVDFNSLRQNLINTYNRIVQKASDVDKMPEEGFDLLKKDLNDLRQHIVILACLYDNDAGIHSLANEKILVVPDCINDTDLSPENEDKYYYLKEGEIIQQGDECEVSSKWNDPPKWVSAAHTVGTPAPNPNYMAHRRYRRLISQ